LFFILPTASSKLGYISSAILSSWNDAYVLTAKSAFNFELNMTIRFSEQGVILAQTNVHASVKLGAALTNDDAARWNQLAAVSFNAKAFCF